MVISPGFSVDLEHVPSSEGLRVKAQRNLASLTVKKDIHVFEKKNGMVV